MKVCIVNWFDSVNVTDKDHWPNSITCSTYESFAEYGSSSLWGYPFAKQEILLSLFLVYTFLYSKYVM